MKDKAYVALEVLRIVARVLDPGSGCLTSCASCCSDEDDCDCGYVEASDDLELYVREAIERLENPGPRGAP